MDEQPTCVYAENVLSVGVPGAFIIRRLLIDRAWYITMMEALDLCAAMGGPEKPREEAVNRLLDLRDEPLSTLERRIIVDYCLHRSEA